jgi:hypothetical protein
MEEFSVRFVHQIITVTPLSDLMPGEEEQHYMVSIKNKFEGVIVPAVLGVIHQEEVPGEGTAWLADNNMNESLVEIIGEMIEELDGPRSGNSL